MKTAAKLLGLTVACAACCAFSAVVPMLAAVGFASIGTAAAGWAVGLTALAVAAVVCIAWPSAPDAWRLRHAPRPSGTAAAAPHRPPRPASTPPDEGEAIMTTSGTAPIACTLTPGDFKARMDWIRDLTSESLLAHHRDELALYLTYAPEAAERVRELLEKEQACCAFLSFDLRADAHAVRLTVTAPEEAKAAADLLFAEFAPTPADIPTACGAPQ